MPEADPLFGPPGVEVEYELGGELDPADRGGSELDQRRQTTSRTEGGRDCFDLRNLSTDQAAGVLISVRRATGLGQSPITAPIRPNPHGLGGQALIK